MFNQTKGFEQDIGNIGSLIMMVSKVSNMEGMFKLRHLINRLEIGMLVKSLEMFDGAINFNQDITNWDVSSLKLYEVP